MLIEAVFISDLHLHPDDKEVKARFDDFIVWAKTAVNKLYILGDFFHVWPGDDALDDWSFGIAKQLRSLVAAGKTVYFLPGNRDFLLGAEFARLAAWEVLPDPTVIQLGTGKILLSHGDRYCTTDRAHQYFTALTRNALFIRLFLLLPLRLRKRLALDVRQISQARQQKIREPIEVVDKAVIKHLRAYQVLTLIHGHTHRPGLKKYEKAGEVALMRYILSAWDDKPQLLCYDNTKGLYFIHF